MKKIFCFLLIFFLFVTISGISQQLVRGYSAAFSYGLLRKGEDFNFSFENTLYAANPVSASAASLYTGLPFDIGLKRHRLVFTPAIDFFTSDYVYTPDKVIPGAGFDTLKLSSFMVIPKLSGAYKYHFYTGSVHYAIGFALNFRLPVYREMKLSNSNKYEMINYDGTVDPSADAFLDFDDSSVHLALWKSGFHIVPSLLFDVYLTKFLITNFFVQPFVIPSKSIQGVNFGIGVSYMIPSGKDNSSDFLQYYKQK